MFCSWNNSVLASSVHLVHPRLFFSVVFVSLLIPAIVFLVKLLPRRPGCFQSIFPFHIPPIIVSDFFNFQRSLSTAKSVACACTSVQYNLLWNSLFLLCVSRSPRIAPSSQTPSINLCIPVDQCICIFQSNWHYDVCQALEEVETYHRTTIIGPPTYSVIKFKPKISWKSPLPYN